MGDHKKAPSRKLWQAEGEGANSQGIGSLGQRLDRYGEARRGTESIIPHIASRLQPGGADGHSPEQAEAVKVLPLLRRCGSKLRFRHYYQRDDLRLVEARSCDKHLLCPFCAVRRMSRTLSRYMDRYHQVAEGRTPYLLTVTVKNGDDLAERFQHLKQSWQKWTKRRRTALATGKGGTELAKMDGAVYSIETTNRGNGWHPHLHALVLVPEGVEVSLERLQAEWEGITGDSYIVDLRPVQSPETGFLEVLKYALKFGDLTPAQTWEAHLTLKGKRLLGSWGCFYGVPEPETADEDPLEDEPYLELVYRWVQDSGYQLDSWEYHDATAEPREAPGRSPASCRLLRPSTPAHSYPRLTPPLEPGQEERSSPATAGSGCE